MNCDDQHRNGLDPWVSRWQLGEPFAEDLQELLRNDFAVSLSGSWLSCEGHVPVRTGGVTHSLSDVDVRCEWSPLADDVRAISAAVVRLADAHHIRIARVSVRCAQEMKGLWRLPRSADMAAQYLLFWAGMGLAELAGSQAANSSAMARSYGLTKFVFKYCRNALAFRTGACHSYRDIVDALHREGLGHPVVERAYRVKLGDDVCLGAGEAAVLLSDHLWSELAMPVARGPCMDTVHSVRQQVLQWYLVQADLPAHSVIDLVQPLAHSPEMRLAWAKARNGLDVLRCSHAA